MSEDLKKHKKILEKIVNTLITDLGSDDFLANTRFLLTRDINVDMIKNILYGIISFYLIDEMALQPVEKINFVDMGSYYYRSESYNIDFPNEYHEKYQIPISHIDREKSIFYSNNNFIKNFLKTSPKENLGSIDIIISEDPDLKMPSSRQAFLIEYFLLYPERFNELFKSRYNSKFKNSDIFKLRQAKNYEQFLSIRLANLDYSEEIKQHLSSIIKPDEDYILTSSGTAANQLVIQYLGNDQSKNFYHKYWYYENLNNNKTNYFHEIETKESSFNNFFINLEPTNFIDLVNPGYIEDVEKSLKILIAKLKESKGKYNLIIDVTSNPFFEIGTKLGNINIIKTMSLSKYQEGLNTSFVGIVIAKSKDINQMLPVSEKFGFTMNELDKRFLRLPDITSYKKRIKKIESFLLNKFPNYQNWEIIPVGLSVILVPNKDIIDFHVKKFSEQTQISDRKFAWLLRDRINELIKTTKFKDMFFGDSFLFPTSRVSIQGPSINAKNYSKNNHKFKYRLPRISPGYDSNFNNIDDYYDFYRGIINIYTEEYSKL